MPRKPIPDKLNTGGILDKLQRIETKPLGQESSAGEEKDDAEQSTASQDDVQEETSETAKQKAASPVRNVSSKTESKAAKTKVNLYLDAKIKRRTEQAQIDLRNIVPANLAGQVNYSLIVETALQIVFDEFDRIGEHSALAQEIRQQVQNKK